jgi:hypothetical protein
LNGRCKRIWVRPLFAIMNPILCSNYLQEPSQVFSSVYKSVPWHFQDPCLYHLCSTWWRSWTAW